jgi:predicted phosphodiesterase
MKNQAAVATVPKTPLTVAIVSDVHAYQGFDADKSPSHCEVMETDPLKNAIVGLKEFIKSQQLTADYLLCPGDLGDKAVPLAAKFVWEELHTIRKLLKAKELITATGNHDVDSRHAHNSYDGKGMLQQLTPRYPFGKEALSDRYWSRHFVLIDLECARILVLNSSAFHGEGKFDQSKKYEYEQGRVSDYTLSQIRTELEKVPTPPPVNIFLCHHHPHRHSELRLGDDDLMMGGGALLEILGSGNFGNWIIIHGHKHHPKLEYAAGGSTAPIVFAAGSASAVLYKELQTVSRNQFYILSFPYSEYDTYGFVGTFQTWNWATGQGWFPASRVEQLPAIGGFGWRGNILSLAKDVFRIVGLHQNLWMIL